MSFLSGEEGEYNDEDDKGLGKFFDDEAEEAEEDLDDQEEGEGDLDDFLVDDESEIFDEGDEEDYDDKMVEEDSEEV
jgi:hypothetical protein